MKVLILAAGVGSRLGLGIPKILVKVGGKSILQHHLHSLKQLGIEPFDITVVTGFLSDRVEKACTDLGMNALNNPFWKFPGTYSSFSLFPHSNDSLLLIHGDLVWEAGLADCIIGKHNGILIPVDPRRREDDEAMKVEVRNGQILHMSKELPVSRSAGESMGMFFLADSQIVKKYSAKLIEDPGSCFDDAVNILAASLKVEAIITDRFDWEEIDTPSDLLRAESRFS